MRRAIATAASVLVLGFGAADAQALSVSPTSLTFAAQAVGSTSAPQGVTLTACPMTSGCAFSSVTGWFYLGHTSSCPVSNGNFAMACRPSTDFVQTSNCPATGTVMASGTSCTMQISFKPVKRGLRLATAHTGNDHYSVLLLNPPGMKVLLSGTGIASKRKRCDKRNRKRKCGKR